MSCNMWVTSVRRGRTVLSSALALAFPRLPLMSKIICLFTLPSSFCFSISAIFNTVPVWPMVLDPLPCCPSCEILLHAAVDLDRGLFRLGPDRFIVAKVSQLFELCRRVCMDTFIAYRRREDTTRGSVSPFPIGAPLLIKSGGSHQDQPLLPPMPPTSQPPAGK